MAQLGSQAPKYLKYALFACGGSKDDKLDESVLKYVGKVLRETKHETVLFSPSDMEVPFVKKPVHHYSDRSEAPEWLRDAEKKLETCDGFVFLCPEINRSIPPALSNMIDYFGTNIYIGKPSAIITYSTDSTDGLLFHCKRHLIDLLLQMQALVLPNAVSIYAANLKIDSDGQLTDQGLKSRVDNSIIKFISQLDWFSVAIKNERSLYQPFPLQ